MTKFGVEIECVGWGGSTYNATEALRAGGFQAVNEGYNTRHTSDSWRVIMEYSVLNGVEIVSPPLTFNQENLDHFGSMLRHIAASGGSMDHRCGMHVHVDASFLSVLPLAKRNEFFTYLLDAYRSNEHLFDRFVKENRRGTRNFYCKSLVGKTLRDVYADREHKLNIQSYTLHGTIEFRHYHGTLNDQAAKAWVTLCVTFLKNVAKAFAASRNIEFPLLSA